jgi:uncharacterized protein YjbJ (UPF0337 family)
MFPEFFMHKMREVKSFLKIMRGKATGNKKDRVEGVDDALNAMKDEKKVYQREKNEARSGRDEEYTERYASEHISDPRDKIARESGGQDISAI